MLADLFNVNLLDGDQQFMLGLFDKVMQRSSNNPHFRLVPTLQKVHICGRWTGGLVDDVCAFLDLGDKVACQ